MDEGTVTTQSRAQSYIIERPRLTKILDESEARIMLLCAPAGYGKTTLARQWVEGKEGVVWYSGGPAMADVAAFAAGIATALAEPSAKAEVGERIQRLASAGQKGPALARVVAATAGGVLCSILVIDDFHHAPESSSSEEFLTQLLKSAPFRLVLTTRMRPRWIAPRMLVYGEAMTVEMDDLAFSPAEVEAVLGASADLADRTLSQARGWPAVVGLAAMRGNGANPSEPLDGSQLYDFFADDLFARMPASLQEELFVLALAGDCEPELAKALTKDRFDAVITEAVARGFVSRGRDSVVAIHPLLRTFLLDRLRQQDENLIVTIRSRVLAILSAHERWDECLAALQAFPDAELILSTIDQASTCLLRAGRIGGLRQWLELASQHDVSDALLLLIEAEVAVREGNHSAAQMLGERAGAQLRGDYAGRAYVAAARAAHMVGDEERVTAWARAACDSAVDLECKRDALWVWYCSALEGKGRRELEILERLVELGSDNPNHSVRLVIAQAMESHHHGPARRARALCLSGRALLPHATDPFIRTSFLNLSSFVAVQAGAYKDAITIAEDLLGEARASGLDFAVGHALVGKASALIGLRRLLAARQTLEAVAVDRCTEDHASANAVLQQVKLLIALSDLERARVLLTREVPASLSLGTHDEFVAYRALIDAAQDKHPDALGAPDDLWSVDAQTVMHLARVIRALRDDDESAPDRATPLLHQALQDGQVDIVVTACRTFPELAAVGARHAETARMLRDVFLLSNDFDLARRAGLEMPRELRRDEPLSPREREVYEHLIAGRSNKQIAQALFISESTTKVHVRHIFEKLGVHTRAEAAHLRLGDDA